jgi:16S rRNA (cytosine967-C5)-methyltransferase
MPSIVRRLRDAGLDAQPVGQAALRLARAVPVEALPGFKEGLVSVQDAGAQLGAVWLGAADGMRVLDACAAPGGKTGHLAELSDADIDAVESDPARARRIVDNLSRLGLQSRVRVHTRDVESFAREAGPQPCYDRILLDAPCTASGIVRRHPDIPWLRRPADVAKLATQQHLLLDALWPLVKPAGRLLYVVCSVFPEEGALQAAAFAARHPDALKTALPPTNLTGMQLVPREAPTPSAPHQAEIFGAADGWQPDVHDGFYYALFEKRGAQG